MEKKMYESPRMEMVKMEVSDMMACMQTSYILYSSH